MEDSIRYHKMKDKIVLTAPHAYCFDPLSEKRNCDRRSEELLECLKESIRKFNDKIKIEDFKNLHLKRIKVAGVSCWDYNRIPCRNTDYREKIAASYEDDKVLCLLDCHSFPYIESFGMHGDPGYKVSVAFLMTSTDPKNELYTKCSILACKLDKVLNKLGHQCAVVQGGENDIINEANKRGTEAFLIEVLEDKTILDERTFKTVCDIISDHVLNFKLKEYKMADVEKYKKNTCYANLSKSPLLY